MTHARVVRDNCLGNRISWCLSGRKHFLFLRPVNISRSFYEDPSGLQLKRYSDSFCPGSPWTTLAARQLQLLQHPADESTESCKVSKHVLTLRRISSIIQLRCLLYIPAPSPCVLSTMLNIHTKSLRVTLKTPVASSVSTWKRWTHSLVHESVCVCVRTRYSAEAHMRQASQMKRKRVSGCQISHIPLNGHCVHFKWWPEFCF